MAVKEQSEELEDLTESERATYDIFEEAIQEYGDMDFQISAGYRGNGEYNGKLPDEGDLEDIREALSEVNEYTALVDGEFREVSRWPLEPQIETSEEEPQISVKLPYQEVDKNDTLVLEIEGYAQGSDFKIEKPLSDD